MFTPDRLAVVKGGPAARRAYFDRSLGRLFPAARSSRASTAAALGQRNAALRRVAAGVVRATRSSPGREQVAELGAALVAAAAGAARACSRRPSQQRAGELGLARRTPRLRRRADAPRSSRRASHAISSAASPALGPHLRRHRRRGGRPRPALLRLAGRAAPRRALARCSPRPSSSPSGPARRRCCCSTTCCRSSTETAAARSASASRTRRSDDRHRDRRRRRSRSSRPSCSSSGRARAGWRPDGADRRRRRARRSPRAAARDGLSLAELTVRAGPRSWGRDRAERLAAAHRARRDAARRDDLVDLGVRARPAAPEIARAAPRGLGDGAPPALRFAPGPVPEPPAAVAAGRRHGAASRRPRRAAPAARAAAAIDDEELRELVARAAARASRRPRSDRVLIHCHFARKSAICRAFLMTESQLHRKRHHRSGGPRARPAATRNVHRLDGRARPPPPRLRGRRQRRRRGPRGPQRPRRRHDPPGQLRHRP